MVVLIVFNLIGQVLLTNPVLWKIMWILIVNAMTKFFGALIMSIFEPGRDVTKITLIDAFQCGINCQNAGI